MDKVDFFSRVVGIFFIFFLHQNPASTQNVFINEIAITPVGDANTNSLFESGSSSDDAEWIELYNPSACDTVDISCFVLGNDLSDPQIENIWGAFTFPPGTVIPPLSHLVIGGNAVLQADINLSNFHNTQFFCHSERWWLLDISGWIALYDTAGNVIDAVYWNTNGDPSLLFSQQSYNNYVTDSCSCLGLKTLMKAKDITGIEFVGKVFSFSGLTNSRKTDGDTLWQISNPTPGSCNGGINDCRNPHTINLDFYSDCNGNKITAQTIFTGNSTGPFTYLWSPGGQDSSAISNVNPGIYLVTVADATGCIKTDSLLVEIQPGISKLEEISICTGDSVFIANKWQTAAGNYFDTIPDTPCDSVIMTTLSLFPSSSVNAGTDTLINEGTTVQLQASGGEQFSWSPLAGLSCSDCSNPVASPSTPTTYSVTSIDSNGCTATDDVKVEIINACRINENMVPTIFSPNGDGLNDKLRLQGNNYPISAFKIFDRWGELVFETSDSNMGWDGTFNGQPLNPAVFVFYLEAECPDEKKIRTEGNITLIR